MQGGKGKRNERGISVKSQDLGEGCVVAMLDVPVSRISIFNASKIATCELLNIHRDDHTPYQLSRCVYEQYA